MSRHIPRSHLLSHGQSLCGRGALILPLEAFLKSGNRCQRCDRARLGLPGIGGRKPKAWLKTRRIYLPLDDHANTVCDRLAAQGLLGRAIGALVKAAIEGRVTDDVLKIWRD